MLSLKTPAGCCKCCNVCIEGVDRPYPQETLGFLLKGFALHAMRDRHSRCSRRFLSISLNEGAKEAMTGEGSFGCQALIA